MPPSELLLTDSERRLALKRIVGFDRLPSDELAAIATRSRRHELAEGALVLSPEETRSSVHILLDGALELTRGGRLVDGPLVEHALDPFWLARDTTPMSLRARGRTLTLELSYGELEEILADHFSVWLDTAAAYASALLDSDGAAARPGGNVIQLATRASASRRSFGARLLALRAALPFGGDNLESLAQLADAAGERSVAAGATLWRAGDRADELVVPLEGALGGVAVDRGGPPGWLAVLAARPHRTTVTATTAARLLRIDREDLLDVLEDHHDFARDCLAGLAAALIEERLG